MAACALALSGAGAQVFADDLPKIQLTPTGRVLVDGALYASPQKENFPDGLAIPEARIGVKMKYGDWSSAVDVGIAYSKIGLRNMWIQYDFNPKNAVRFGNFIHQFGLQSTSSSVKCTFEQPVASAPFTPGLQLGAMYTHTGSRMYSATSFAAETSALTQAMNYPAFNQQGYSMMTRNVWHSSKGHELIWHIGISGAFSTPQRHLADNFDIHDAFTVMANFPTRVAQKAAVSATVDNAMNLFKLSPEIVAAKGPVAFEGQYFFQQINRRQSLQAFRSQSAYATVRAMITGGSYSYSSGSAQLVNPTSNALEFVANYNYTDLSDLKADILGGRANSLSATLNYYFNPYITARLNYTYTHTWDRRDTPSFTLSAIQARLMVLF